MGDISEIRILVVVFGFLGLSVFLMGLIPSDFFAYSYEGRTVEAPEYFEASQLEYYDYAETWNHTMDGTDCIDNIDQWIKPFDFGGHNLNFKYSKANKTHAYGDAIFQHFWYWWIFPTAHHNMEWFNKDGIDMGNSLEKEELDNDYGQGNIKYMVKCDHFSMTVFFGFNETLWSKPSDAWNHNDLRVLTGIKFDQVNTSINAWNIISMLIFFQLPDVNWFIGFILGLCLWIPVAYVSMILILRVIGAVFGGGGA